MKVEEIRLTNAAGGIKNDTPFFQRMLGAPVERITFGSITVLSRLGNGGDNFRMIPGKTGWTSVNAIGLKNDGIEKYDSSIDEIIEQVHGSGKLFRLSVAPLSLKDIEPLVSFANRHRVDVVELNLGCPNVKSGNHPEIIAYNPAWVKIAIKLARKNWKKKLAVKLSPYEKEHFSRDLGRCISKFLGEGDAVVLTNTLPDFKPLDQEGRPILKANDPNGKPINSGGMGGEMLRPLSLQVVEWMADVLPLRFTIEGCGGISKGEHVLEYEKRGARAFQVGTALFEMENPRIFEEILLGYPGN